MMTRNTGQITILVPAFLLTFLFNSAAGFSKVIWEGGLECIRKPSGALAACNTIDKPGRTAFAPPMHSIIEDDFVKTMLFTSIVVYNYNCAGRADDTFLLHGQKEFPMVFGKEGGEIRNTISYNDDSSYRLVRLSRSFSTISGNCTIEIVSNRTLPENLDALRTYTLLLKQVDTFLTNAINATVPGATYYTVKSQLDSSKSFLGFLLLTTTDPIAKASIERSLSAIELALQYLSVQCSAAGNVASCTPELNAVQTLLSVQAASIDSKLTNVKTFLEDEKARLIAEEIDTTYTAKIDEILALI